MRDIYAFRWLTQIQLFLHVVLRKILPFNLQLVLRELFAKDLAFLDKCLLQREWAPGKPKMRKTQSWGIYSYNPTKSQLVKSWWTGVFGKEPKIESRCGVVIGILKWTFWWHGNITPKEFNSQMFILIWHLLGKHHITVTSLGTVSVS